MEAWVTIEKLKKKIDDFELGPINLTIKPGTITAVIGKNGSGKSTLLKQMMHLIKPDTGYIKLFGQFISSHQNWKSHISYLPQSTIGVSTLDGGVLQSLTANCYSEWDENLFQHMIHLFEVPLNKKYNKLSQGLQKKLSLALTIASNASLLILDEPTAYMDIPSKKILGDILIDWMDNGERSIIMTSHQVEDIRKYSDYIVILNKGSMLGAFEKDELLEHHKRYWIKNNLPQKTIPGEISRDTGQFTTNDPKAAEQFLNDSQIKWYEKESMDLEEIITVLMSK